MHARDTIEYHSARAQKELDLSLTATVAAALRTHLQLAALHMKRMREVAGGSEPRQPLLTM